MKNVNLNAGGILGGLLGAAGAAAVIISLEPEQHERWMTRLLIGGVVAGALAGNALRAWVAARRAAPTDGEPIGGGREPNGRSCAICGADLAGAKPGVTLCVACRGRTG